MDQQQLVSYQDKFKRDYALIAQQMRPRLNNYYDWTPDAIEGRYFYFNYIGTVDPRVKTEWAGPTPVMSPAHTRNQGSTITYEWGDVYDDDQLKKMISDPQSRHKMAAVAGFYRKMDLVGITAALGNRVSMNADGTTTSNALPNGQVVGTAIGGAGTGLNIAKLRRARRLFEAAELREVRPQPEPEAFLCSAAQLDDLLSTTEVTSDLYNSVKALVDGKVDHFMGFNFIRTEQLPTTGGGLRRCVALAAGALGGYMEPQPAVKMGPDASSSFANRVYMTQVLGATRQEDVRVVEVQCTES